VIRENCFSMLSTVAFASGLHNTSKRPFELFVTMLAGLYSYLWWLSQRMLVVKSALQVSAVCGLYMSTFSRCWGGVLAIIRGGRWCSREVSQKQ
jgi:hypothetical protein